jgi:hypothetical protein
VANFEAVKVRWSYDVRVVRYADPIWLVGPGNVAQGGLHITSGALFLGVCGCFRQTAGRRAVREQLTAIFLPFPKCRFISSLILRFSHTVNVIYLIRLLRQHLRPKNLDRTIDGNCSGDHRDCDCKPI